MRSRLLLFVLLSLSFSCQEDPKEYLRTHKQNILRVIVESGTFPADGRTFMTISAFIPSNADKKTIRFTTTSGKFQFSDSNTYSVDATVFKDSLRAQAFLVSATDIPDKILVKVAADIIDTTLMVNYSVAFADSVANESTVASIKRGYGSEVPVKTTLIRNVGTPSQHQFVNLTALRSNQTTIGEFRGIDPSGSDKNGVINATFVLKDTTYTGPVRIISTYRGSTSNLTDTLTVFVTQK